MKHQKRRFLWIDWMILFSVAVIVFVGVRYLVGRREEARENLTVEYVLHLSARSVSAEDTQDWTVMIPVGANVANANATAAMGRVTGLEIRPHKTMTVRDGEVLAVDVPDCVDLYVTVRAGAIDRGGDGLRVADIRIAAGESGDYYLGNYYAAGAVTVVVREVSEE